MLWRQCYLWPLISHSLFLILLKGARPDKLYPSLSCGWAHISRGEKHLRWAAEKCCYGGHKGVLSVHIQHSISIGDSAAIDSVCPVFSVGQAQQILWFGSCQSVWSRRLFLKAVRVKCTASYFLQTGNRTDQPNKSCPQAELHCAGLSEQNQTFSKNFCKKCFLL